MITLEQIRLLESKITRALDLIRVLKEENSTLRKGLESAQRRMRELETLVDGFKTDQKEIESVIVRTLHNLDELEEPSAAGGRPAAAGGARARSGRRSRPRLPRPPNRAVTPAQRFPRAAGGQPRPWLPRRSTSEPPVSQGRTGHLLGIHGEAPAPHRRPGNLVRHPVR